jgi:acyl carrier protein
MSSPDAIEAKIRDVLREHGRLNKPLEQIEATTDLYQAGMTSHASVNVMLALEGAFDIEFADHMLKRSVFASVSAIREAVTELTQASPMR